MSENIKSGWLKDATGQKFAPFTILDNIYNKDGTAFSVLDKDGNITVINNINLGGDIVFANNKTIQENAMFFLREGTISLSF